MTAATVIDTFFPQTVAIAEVFELTIIGSGFSPTDLIIDTGGVVCNATFVNSTVLLCRNDDGLFSAGQQGLFVTNGVLQQVAAAASLTVMGTFLLLAAFPCQRHASDCSADVEL